MTTVQIGRFLAFSSLVALFAGVFVVEIAQAAGKAEEAKKYHSQLKSSTDSKKKVIALEELGKIGQIQTSLVKPAIPDIMAALSDKDATVRAAAAEALGRCEPDPKEALPALRKLLKDDPSEQVKIAATNGLAAMGTSAKDALGDLRQIVKMGKDKDGKQSRLGRAAGQAARVISGR